MVRREGRYVMEKEKNAMAEGGVGNWARENKEYKIEKRKRGEK